MISIEILYLFLGGFTLFAFLIGAAAGWWLGMRSGSKRKNKPTEKPAVAEQTKDSAEILRFVRERSNSSLVMELRGKVYRRAEELTDVERKNLIRFGRDWLKWLGELQQAATVDSVEPVRTETQPLTGVSDQLQVSVATSVPQKGTPISQINPAEVAATPLSIVEQIDEILQELLLQSPLANQKIKLTEDPKQGAAVWVGEQCFAEVDAVPDPEVRAIIRRAAQEWERRGG